MSERLPQTGSPFSVRTAAILVVVSLVSLGAVLTLMAWSPDLASRDRAGPTPYSRSAVGYAGLVKMLEGRGHSVSVSRRRDSVEYGGGRLLVLTLPLFGQEISPDDIGGPALIIAPKWSFIANPAKKSWELNTTLADLDAVDAAASVFDETIEVVRLRNPGTIDLPSGEARPDFENEMQVLRSDTLEPVVDVAGGMLLAKIPDRDIYILSDPDLLNNFGLARLENAKAGLGMIELIIAESGRPIIFDATLHGFERSTNLMKILLSIPWLGATLVALAAMGLIGWAAAVRFGAPERETRAIAAGKRALADNSAGLISMARRERRMAPGYLSLSRRALVRELGLPKNLSEAETTALLQRMGEQAGLDTDYSSLNDGLSAPAGSREDLRHKARALWRWRREMKHGQ